MESAVRGGHRRRGKPAHAERNENEKTANKISNSTGQKKEPLEGPDNQREQITLQKKQAAAPARAPGRARTGATGDTAVRRVREKLLGEQGQPPYILYICLINWKITPPLWGTHTENPNKQTVRFLLLPLGDLQSRRTCSEPRGKRAPLRDKGAAASSGRQVDRRPWR